PGAIQDVLYPHHIFKRCCSNFDGCPGLLSLSPRLSGFHVTLLFWNGRITPYIVFEHSVPPHPPKPTAPTCLPRSTRKAHPRRSTTALSDRAQLPGVSEQRDEVAPPHSITSSARAISVGGTSRPSTFAVLRLMTNSNLVGCSIGNSEAFAPLRILTTNAAARRLRSGTFGP